MGPESLRRRFRVERLGDLTLNWIKVLVYLGTSKSGSREPSAERLAKETLGLGSENVITEYAYPALLKKGYIRLLARNLPERDANSYELTEKGRKAMGQLLNAVGFFELGIMVVISLVVGAMIGAVYLAYLQYPSYLALVLALGTSAGIVEVFFLYVFVRMAKQRRREMLSIMLQKSP
jgi:uncharacterized protein YacL